VVYTADALGRVTARGDLSLEYGPTGDAAVARRGGRTFTFTYDEQGRRLVKREGATIRAVYVGHALLDAATDTLYVPFEVDGRVVGIFAARPLGNTFEPLATDPRGSLLGDGGVANLATPYGARVHHPAYAAAVDYVEKGYDADLDLVRMGARDYDPALGEFLTPDPLLLEDAKLVAARPIAGNLFTYASGDPIARVDPDGRFDGIEEHFQRILDASKAVGVAGGAAAGVAVEGAGWVVVSLGAGVVVALVGVELYILVKMPQLAYYAGCPPGAEIGCMWGAHEAEMAQQQAAAEAEEQKIGEQLDRLPEQEIEQIEETVAEPHKNSRRAQVRTHVYTIYWLDTKHGTFGVYKYGVSSLGVRVTDGKSRRAESQVRNLNKEAQRNGNGMRYFSSLGSQLEWYPNRALALVREQQLVTQHFCQYGYAPPGNTLPRPGPCP
jgi:RHS repeat-associated protein